eukprot:scaffold133855_cov77-Cyclotella_meneghiniana.AAC.3
MNNSCVISGIIINRRSIGRNLAFADVKITKTSTNYCADKDSDEAPSIKVKFNRRIFLGADENRVQAAVSTEILEDTFPTKKTSLPYGAKVKMQLVRECSDQSSTDTTWEVLRWKIVQHPKELAEDLALLEVQTSRESSVRVMKQDSRDIFVGNGALSCSTYLKIRREQFDKATSDRKWDVCTVSKQTHKSHNHNPTLDTQLATKSDHGGKHAKGKRAKIFADWVLQTFVDTLPEIDKFCHPCNSTLQNLHVLDIAGGKGHLSLELVLQQASNKLPAQSRIARCTIIDPVVRKGDAKMRQSKLHKMKTSYNHRTEPTVITHHASYFTSDSLKLMHNDFIDSCEADTKLLLLGLHPDQCTEDIVDAALKHNTSFAIVPCCVYSDLFPSRRLYDNFPVRSYDTFLKYLMQKDNEIKMTTLPFEGKNVVLYKVVN